MVVDTRDADDRELGTLIRQYREHRDSLRRLSATAPDARLAERYEKLVEAISRTIDRLAEMQDQQESHDLEEFSTPLVEAPPDRAGHHQTMYRQEPEGELSEDTDERPMSVDASDFVDEGSGTWDRPIIRDSSSEPYREDSGSKLPIVVILVVAIPVLAAIIWYTASGEPESSSAEAATQQAEPVLEEAVEAPPRLLVSPARHDYGLVRAGTRSSNIFTVQNNADNPLEMSVDRSACRCLWYDLPDEAIRPGESARLVITVDGGRAAGALEETVVIRDQAGEAVAEVDVDARIE